MTYKHSLKTLLVNPKNTPDDVIDPKNTLYPYSLLYLVSYLKKTRCGDADYIDMYMEDGDQTLYDKIEQEGFGLIGFTANLASRHNAVRMAKEVKKHFPNVTILVGGIFFGTKPVEALECVPEIDFVISGEGEDPLAELVEALDGGGLSFADIHSLTWRDGETVVKNRARRFEKNLTKYDVDLDLVMKPGYEYTFPLKGWEDDPSKQNAYPLMVGRGCINACIYCINQKIPFRHLPVDNLIDKIEDIKKRFNTTNFMFGDPSFCSSIDFVREFCTALIKRKVGVKWYCEGRPDIDLEVLDLMAEAGLICYDFALESGSVNIQKILKRRTDLEHISSVSMHLKKLGVRGDFFSMISLPQEGPVDAFQTLKYIRKLNKLGFRTTWKPLFIMPGTKLEIMAEKKGILPKDFSWFDPEFSCDLPHVLPGGRLLPHYVERIDPYLSYRLRGFHLAMQDFITTHPRVRNLRWRFLKTIAEVTLFFLSDRDKNTPRHMAEVLMLAARMTTWFLWWKLKKPLYDTLPVFETAKKAKQC